jgi:excisionase family DNA binding protein
MSDQYLRPQDLANQFCVTRRTIDRWAKQGDLPRPLKVRGTVRYPRAAVSEWVAAGCPTMGQARSSK